MHDDLCPVDPPRMDDGFCIWCEVIAKVRADERERNREADGVAAYLAEENALIDLRAKVEALLPERPQPQYLSGWDAALADVLALFDEEQR